MTKECGFNCTTYEERKHKVAVYNEAKTYSAASLTCINAGQQLFIMGFMQLYPIASVLVKVTGLFSTIVCKLLAMAISNFAFLKQI